MIAGLAGFVGLVALLHALRGGELPAADHFVSEYARGEWGWVMRLAFLAWAASLALLARRWRGVAGGALAVAAAGALLAAVATTQTVAGELPAGVQRTTEGRVHDLGSLLLFLGLLVAAIASVVRVRRRSFRLAVGGLGLILLAVVPALVALGIDAPGFGQRGFIAVGLVWQALAVREVRANATPAARPG